TNRKYDKEEFNLAVAPYSHVEDTARLLGKKQSPQAATIAYEPGQPGGLIVLDNVHAINVYRPGHVKPQSGNHGPWLDFMTHLIPGEEDRHEALKYCATLIARPDVRMLYAILLVSEVQGVGKTTLAEKILAPLVGMHNTSFPNEKQVTESRFN